MRSPKQTRARNASSAATQDASPTPVAVRSIIYATQNQDLEMVRLLTVQECGRLSSESPWTWRSRAYLGVVKSVKLGGPKSRVLIPMSEVLIEWGAKYGIVAAHLKRMGVVRVSKDNAAAVLGYPAPAAGWLIPYFDIEGNKTNFFRICFDDYQDTWASVTGRKPLRYAQTKGSGVAVYFDPTVAWRIVAADTSKRLLITEVEMKAACAVAHGFLCIGLGGVASWHGTKQGHVLHPQVLDINW